MPPEAGNSILHACLTSESIVLMGSDMGENGSTGVGNRMSLMLNCGSEDEVRRHFASLSAGGNVTQPLQDAFWGALFGQFTDKFGINWMLHFDKSSSA